MLLVAEGYSIIEYEKRRLHLIMGLLFILSDQPITAKVSTPAGMVRVLNRVPLLLNNLSVYETFVKVSTLLNRTTP